MARQRRSGGEDLPGLGGRWADEVLPSDLEEALRFVEARAGLHAYWRAVVREAIGRVVRTSDASGAAYNAVGAWRRLFKVAVQDRHLAKGFDPSQEIDKPRRSEGTRRALEQSHLDETLGFIGSSGDDPELDLMICEAILIAGARQEGILNLTLDGVDLEECAVPRELAHAVVRLHGGDQALLEPTSGCCATAAATSSSARSVVLDVRAAVETARFRCTSTCAPRRPTRPRMPGP